MAGEKERARERERERLLYRYTEVHPCFVWRVKIVNVVLLTLPAPGLLLAVSTVKGESMLAAGLPFFPAPSCPVQHTFIVSREEFTNNIPATIPYEHTTHTGLRKEHTSNACMYVREHVYIHV